MALRRLPPGVLDAICERADCGGRAVRRVRRGQGVRSATRDRIIAAATALGVADLLFERGDGPRSDALAELVTGSRR